MKNINKEKIIPIILILISITLFAVSIDIKSIRNSYSHSEEIIQVQKDIMALNADVVRLLVENDRQKRQIKKMKSLQDSIEIHITKQKTAIISRKQRKPENDKAAKKPIKYPNEQW